MTALMVAAIIVAYAFSAAFAAGILSRWPETFNHIELPPPGVAGAFWPITLVIAIIVLAFRKAYRLGRDPVGAVLGPVYRLGRGGENEEEGE